MPPYLRPPWPQCSQSVRPVRASVLAACPFWKLCLTVISQISWNAGKCTTLFLDTLACSYCMRSFLARVQIAEAISNCKISSETGPKRICRLANSIMVCRVCRHPSMSTRWEESSSIWFWFHFHLFQLLRQIVRFQLVPMLETDRLVGGALTSSRTGSNGTTSAGVAEGVRCFASADSILHNILPCSPYKRNIRTYAAVAWDPVKF